MAARSSMTVAAGCAILLAGSGVLEGFVTPSQLPDAVKIALGVVMTAAVWAYTLILGRRAHQAGQDADVGIDAGRGLTPPSRTYRRPLFFNSM